MMIRSLDLQRDAGLDQAYLYHEFASGVRDDPGSRQLPVRPGGREGLVVWKLDRLGRNDGAELRLQDPEGSVPSTFRSQRAAALRLAHQAHPLAAATDHRLDEDRKADGKPTGVSVRSVSGGSGGVGGSS